MVRIERRSAPVVSVDHDSLMDLVRTAFGQRRKMLRRSLSSKVTTEQFEAAGIDPSERPERLDVVQWGALTAAVLAGA
jgi:16S rRNA (adenine1518-N6/adenine1519-N6)-dimethyltransferase